MRGLLAFVALCACSAREPEPWPPPVELKKPPARPELATSTGDTRWFVVDQFFLGRRFRNGVHDWRAWAEYGYDLDDRATTKEESELSARTCRRREGSVTAVLADGVRGVDNNVGKYVIPPFAALGAILANDLDAALLPSLEWRGFCRDKATHAQVASTIHSSVDLLADGGDDARECDAVSVGVGFTMRPIAGLAGTTGSPAPPVTECGTDASAP